MSNEQNGPGIDPLVSDTYRELADETTPETLNREVLRMAARETRTRYAVARAWTRPVAWAATIGLSLVLVLQLADTPEPAATEIEATAFERKDADTIGARREGDVAPEAAAPSVLPASAPADAGRASEADAQAALPAVAKRSRSEMQQQEEKVSVMNDAPVAAPQDVMAEEEVPARSYVSRDIVQEAREKARLQESLQQAPKEEALARQRAAALQADSVGESAELSSTGMAQVGAERTTMQPTVSIAATDDAREFLCPADARKTPEEWLDCISAIEKTAPAELVDREYEALHQRFPDFEQVSR